MGVASLVEALGAKLRRRQVELKSSAFSSYRQLLQAAANDEQIDLDEFELVLESNNKTPEDFAADVEEFKVRIVDAARLKRGAELEAKLRTSEAKRLQLVDELQAAMNRIQPQIDACHEERRTLEAAIAGCHGAAERLLNSTMDPAALANAAELAQRRVEINNRLRPLTDKRGQLESRVSYYQAIIAGHESYLNAEGGDPRTKGERRSGIKEARENLDSFESQLREVNQQIAQINTELRAVEDQQRQLRDEMLVP